MRRLLAIVCFLATPLAAQHEAHPQGQQHEAADPHAGHAMTGPLGIPMSRTGSGTAWLPDPSPMYALHGRAGSWTTMLHGNLFVQYIDEGSDRGDAQFGSINWVMGMADRPLGEGQLLLRAMLSAERWTVGLCGYPDLLATGESCNGAPIHDRQHPHDLFMELAASYQLPLTERLALEVYGGPVAEPALGPVAYPHRPSAFPMPLAPIGHHWLDATHIAFGNVTAGLFGKYWKVEASLFNGREPDENRLDLDLARLDSYSGRVSAMPGPQWVMQLSAGHLHDAEEDDSGVRQDVTRYTASVIHHREFAEDRLWATTLAYGRNVAGGHATGALLFETAFDLAEKDIVSLQGEWVEKDAHELALPPDFASDDEIFLVAKTGVRYLRQFETMRGWLPGVGAGLSHSFIPAGLEPVYGTRSAWGFVLFGSLRPAASMPSARE